MQNLHIFRKYSLKPLNWIFIISIITISATLFSIQLMKGKSSKVTLAGKEIFVSIADTHSLRERGLSGRKGLQDNEGMLFVFPETGMYGFWMKEMLFPLDIVWFDENQTVIDVWENATPDSYPKVYTPQSPALYVLEVPAGYIYKNNIKSGNILRIL